MRPGSKTPGWRRRASSPGGPERLVVAMALLLPVGVIVLLLGNWPATGLASPTSLMHTEVSTDVISKRPVGTSADPPPTLVPPVTTPTAVPTAVVRVSPTSLPKGSYTVQRGDELKHIAAAYNVSMAKIIAANDIPNPDSLRIGQVLRIPEN